MLGLKASKVFLRDDVFLIPIDEVLCPICLCKLVKSTTSESNRPILPTPAPAKYIAKGQPIPPAPIIATLFVIMMS